MKLSFRTFIHFSRVLTKLPSQKNVQQVSTKPVKRPVNEIPVFDEQNHEFRSSKKEAVQTLETLFQIKTFDAYKIVSSNKNLCKTNPKTIKENYALYFRHNISKEVLLQYPSLLSETEIENKINLLKNLPHDLNDIIVLVKLSEKHLQKMVEQTEVNQSEDRIAVLSSCLQVDKLKSCEAMCKKSFMRTVPIQKIQSTSKLLSDYGIPPNEIVNDLWIFNYSNELIINRFNLAKEHNIETMKTWMVRAMPDIFQHYMQRRSDNKLILGDNSLAEYLSERLECTIDMANYLILKQPVLKNKSLKKLKDLIDYLFYKGFKPYHICRIPKILVHSVETTQKRLKLLEDNNIQIDSLHMLTKSKKQFLQYYEILMKNKHKNKS